MVLHRGLGVGYCQIIKEPIASILCSPKHHVEIHHIVHDGVMGPVAWFYFSWPAQYGSYYRIEECGKRVGRSHDNILVLLRMVHLIAFAIRAEHQETDVVVVAWAIGDVPKAICVSFG